jgi:hypothetical protein
MKWKDERRREEKLGRDEKKVGPHKHKLADCWSSFRVPGWPTIGETGLSRHHQLEGGVAIEGHLHSSRCLGGIRGNQDECWLDSQFGEASAGSLPAAVPFPHHRRLVLARRQCCRFSCRMMDRGSNKGSGSEAKSMPISMAPPLS